MTPKRAAAWTLVAALAAAWFASAAGVIGQPPRAPRTVTRTPQAAQVEAVSFDVAAQAQRLRQRLAAAPAPRPVRNPFDFAPREPLERAAARIVAAPPPPSPPVDIEPTLQLIGIAEDGVGAALVRTAMIADGEELLMVRLGQLIAGRYTVSAIGVDAVELKDATTDRVRRLNLR
jgi:hypothetical protein